MKVRDSIATDIAAYLLNHIGDARNVPIDEHFCDYVKQRVLSYYHVDEMKFLWKQCDPAIEAEIIKTMQDYSVKANQMMRSSIDKCNDDKQAPTWEMLRNTMREKNGDKGLDRFVSTINILSTSNAGILPTPLGSDKNYYYYRLGYSQKVARVSVKKPGIIDVVSCDYEVRDLESLKSSMQGKSSMLPYVGLFNQGIGMKTYNILPDGSAKGKIKDKSGNIHDYRVKAPHLEIYRNGEVVLRNAFDETYTSNHEYSNIDFSVELDIKSFSFKWKNNGEMTYKVKADGISEGEVSEKGGNVTKIGGKVKISSNNLGAKYDINKKSVTFSGDAKIGPASVGMEYTSSENSYGIGGNAKLSNGIGSAKVNMKRSISHNQENSQHIKDEEGLTVGVAGDALKFGISSSEEYDKVKVSSENNTYVGQLPSYLLTEIYSKKIDDFISNGTPMYSDVIVDHHDNIIKQPLTDNEIKNIKGQLLDNASKVSNQDFKYIPSDFNLFSTCFTTVQ